MYSPFHIPINIRITVQEITSIQSIPGRVDSQPGVALGPHVQGGLGHQTFQTDQKCRGKRQQTFLT